ncbi:hypothetical protein HYV11_00235 [Candidatus Dependentiae bacterium]|nr:hypothetical protein [Candidatus Dependentiae bacterium]
MKRFVFTAFLLLFCSACQKKIAIKTIPPEPWQLQESLAKLSDLPDIPLSIKVQKIEFSQLSTKGMQIFGNLLSNSWFDIKEYYEQEMERFGWCFLSEYKAESNELLVFSRPNGCLLMLSYQEAKQIVITVLNKKEML